MYSVVAAAGHGVGIPLVEHKYIQTVRFTGKVFRHIPTPSVHELIHFIFTACLYKKAIDAIATQMHVLTWLVIQLML